MSIVNDSRHLKFPLAETAIPEPVVSVRDVDVVGAGGLRRAQLTRLLKGKSVILQTHPRLIPPDVQSIYEAELVETMRWLRPLREEVVESFDFIPEQKELFHRLFPKTEKYLGSLSDRIQDAYLSEMQWSSWLLQDHWRYLPGFLRQKFPEQKRLQEIGHWEWVQCWLEVQPFSSPQESPYVTVNPSLQIVSLAEENTFLERAPGLYSFVYDLEGERLAEKKLDVYEACLLDLLHEDRLYSEKQLVEAALLEEVNEPLAAEGWWDKLRGLGQSKVIISARG